MSYKVYGTNAERQAAYRQRLRHKKQDSKPENVLHSLHQSIKEAAQEGDALAELLRGSNPAETARNVASHFESIVSAKFASRFTNIRF